MALVAPVLLLAALAREMPESAKQIAYKECEKCT